MDGHPIKRQKPYGSTYQKDLERLFSGIIEQSRQGDQYAWCVPCAHDIKICASGEYDLRDHLKMKLHARSDKEFGSAFNDVTFLLNDNPLMCQTRSQQQRYCFRYLLLNIIYQ